MGDLFNNLFTRNTPQQPSTNEASKLPPAPNPVYTDKPTNLQGSGFRYNAFNVDKLNVDVVSRQGFNNRTADFIVWDKYQYNVKELIANANEIELSKFVRWAMEGSEISDFSIDFTKGGQTVITGKYDPPISPIPIPFKVNLNIEKTRDNKLLFTFGDVKAIIPVPDVIRDYLITSLLNLKETPGILDDIKVKNAFVRVNDNMVLFDPDRIDPKVQMPIKFFEMSDTGITVHAGTNEELKTNEEINATKINGSVSNSINPTESPAPAPSGKESSVKPNSNQKIELKLDGLLSTPPQNTPTPNNKVNSLLDF